MRLPHGPHRDRGTQGEKREMSKTLATAARAAPPPFWQQLPKIFTYPANGDALVKIVSLGVGGALARLLPLGGLWASLCWLAFMAYCFGILERTARGHLVAAETYLNERTDRDWRPFKQVVVLILGLALVGAASM